MEITVRTPETLGCTVLSTVLLQSLRSTFQGSEIIVYTKFPDLFQGFTHVTKIVDLTAEPNLDSYDIDLEGYVEERKPQTSLPRRHLIEHTFEIAEERLGTKLERGFKLLMNLTDAEIAWAKEERTRISPSKPLVWLQTKSRKAAKDASEEIWEQLIRKGSESYTFLDLSEETYTRRQAVALTKAANAGITLDTFLLHGSEAVGAKNVIVLLVSTYPEVVCYPDQIVLKHSEEEPITADAILTELNVHA